MMREHLLLCIHYLYYYNLGSVHVIFLISHETQKRFASGTNIFLCCMGCINFLSIERDSVETQLVYIKQVGHTLK
jgi:hypothetical protein